MKKIKINILIIIVKENNEKMIEFFKLLSRLQILRVKLRLVLLVM